MKSILYFFICLFYGIAFSQGTSNTPLKTNLLVDNNNSSSQSSSNIGSNGFKFNLIDAGTNTEYAEIGSDIFKNKFIYVTSKKIGAVAKTDPNTGEGYKELFIADISINGSLSRPLLYSRILNTNNSEDNLTYSPDQQTIYYTRSDQSNSLEFKLYKADLQENTTGVWLNHTLVNINKPNVSIETPFVNNAGDKLYFSSNMSDSKGGFDLYVSTINADGSLGTPKNLGSTINTVHDEKYPALSVKDKHLFFSSKGHDNLGGYDVFRSRVSKDEYATPINMGNTINTSYDEIAYFLAARNKGYVTSNRPNGKGSYDIYTATNEDVAQAITGTITEKESKIKLPNTLVILEDIDGDEVARTTSDENGIYSLDVLPFENYNLKTTKDGYKEGSTPFYSGSDKAVTYEKDLELLITEPVITKVDDELQIVLENIYFDFNKWNVKEESYVSLNKVVKVLNEHPEMNLAINAHTDNKGSDTYNMGLSKKRAASAFKYIVSKGIDESRLQSKGFGESKPRIDCKNNCSETDLQANRRVEFVILD